MNSDHDDKTAQAKGEPPAQQLAPTPLPKSPSLVRRTVAALAMGSALFIGACGDDKAPPSDKMPPQTTDFPVGLDPQTTDIGLPPPDTSLDAPQPGDFTMRDSPAGDGARDLPNDAPQAGDFNIAPQPAPMDGGND